MLSRGIRYGFVVAGVLLIIAANVWFVQAPDTLRAYTDLFFMNTAEFYDYKLDTFNIQYIVAFILYLNLLQFAVLSDINESPSFIALMQYRCGSRKTFHLLLKEEIQELAKCIVLTIVTIMAVCILKGGLAVLVLEDAFLLLLYGLRFCVVVCAFLMVYNMASVLENSTKGLLVISFGMIALILLDVLSGLHWITFSGSWMVEGVMIVLTCLLLAVLYNFALWKIRRGS